MRTRSVFRQILRVCLKNLCPAAPTPGATSGGPPAVPGALLGSQWGVQLPPPTYLKAYLVQQIISMSCFIRISLSRRLVHLLPVRGNGLFTGSHTIVIRTHDKDKNPYIPSFLPTILGPDYYVPP